MGTYKRRRTSGANNSFLDGSQESHTPRKTSPGRKSSRRRKIPLGAVIAADILIAGVILLFFYLSNYVWEKEITAEPLGTGVVVSETTVPDETQDTIQTDAQTTPDVTDNEQVQTTPAVDMTIWRNKYADKFTDGEVIKTDKSYQSANVNVSMQRVEVENVVYFVADIYIADIKYFKTAFGENQTSGRQFVNENLISNNGIVGINGDNCWNNPCLLVRNGIYYDLYSSSTSDSLVMYSDGSMETISGMDFDFEQIKAMAPYQVWGFGPMLLDADGQPMSEFNSTVAGRANPHTAVGYYEPGHYCFVVVDGRRPDDYSAGMTMAQLSQLMYDLGCKVAFNLDGGDTSQMAFMDDYYNIPSGSRKADDMIFITDSEE